MAFSWPGETCFSNIRWSTCESSVIQQPNFGAFIPDIGFPEFEHGATPQQEFNMSARYVRLPDEAVQPGDANASVEVVVTYL
jgi:hypothetical protein